MKLGFQCIQPCLWFDSESEQAANFHTSIPPNSRIVATTYYTNESAVP